ncbi:MAG: hypothetical protein Q9213_000573 [Squamulea squamosa]
MDIIEQKEIYRTIIAIQKQSQGKSGSQAKCHSIADSSHSTPVAASPPSPASHTNSRETSLPGEETTLVSLPPSRSKVFMNMSLLYVPYVPSPSVLQEPETNQTQKNSSSRSVESISETRHGGMDTKPSQSYLGSGNTPQIKATVDDHCVQSRWLDLFVLKPFITDDPTRGLGAISLTFRMSKIPMQQVDIRKQLSTSNKEDLQSVLDEYLDLFDHERAVISHMIDDIGSHASLMHLNRTHVDMSYREILFKGLPELQFILESLVEEKQDRGSKGDTFVWKSSGELARRSQRHPHPSKDRSRDRSIAHRLRGRSHERYRRPSYYQGHESRSPSPKWNIETQRKLQRLAMLERKEAENSTVERAKLVAEASKAAEKQREMDRFLQNEEFAATEEVIEIEQRRLEELKYPAQRTEEVKDPIIVNDAISQRLVFPFHLCKSWQGVSDLINEAFLHVEAVEPHVREGHYDLMSSNGEIILPTVWETVIEPGAEISMHMWPLPESMPSAVVEENITVAPPSIPNPMFSIVSWWGTKALRLAKGTSDTYHESPIQHISDASDSSDESEDVDDDAMDDVEAETAVKELLAKYTTLGVDVG